jgi:hypothetical protein
VSRHGSNNDSDWTVWWRRKYTDGSHGSLGYRTKKAAIESAKKHDLPREYAEVRHPRTHEVVFQCGNQGCFELPPELHPDDVERPKATAKTFSYRRWVNVYSRTFGSGALSRMFDSAKEADKYASEDRVACVEVVVEGKAGDGLRSAG